MFTNMPLSINHRQMHDFRNYFVKVARIMEIVESMQLYKEDRVIWLCVVHASV